MDAQSRGLAVAGVKLRSMWRTESVETTVLMPSLAASRPELHIENPLATTHH